MNVREVARVEPEERGRALPGSAAVDDQETRFGDLRAGAAGQGREEGCALFRYRIDVGDVPGRARGDFELRHVDELADRNDVETEALLVNRCRGAGVGDDEVGARERIAAVIRAVGDREN